MSLQNDMFSPWIPQTQALRRSFGGGIRGESGNADGVEVREKCAKQVRKDAGVSGYAVRNCAPTTAGRLRQPAEAADQGDEETAARLGKEWGRNPAIRWFPPARQGYLRA